MHPQPTADKRIPSGHPNTIPKVINFIWVGTRLMPDMDLVNIFHWLQNNPTFRVHLWIDNSAYLQKQESNGHTIETDYQEKFNNPYFSSLPNIRELSSRIEFHDINREGLADPYVRYQIDKLRPNYGAASDLLRYEILRRYGGVYLDCDVLPAKSQSERLENLGIFGAPLHGHILAMDGNSVGEGVVSNHILIATPQNPIITKISEDARKNHNLLRENLVRISEAAYGTRDNGYEGYLCGETLAKTGPQVLHNALDLVQFPTKKTQRWASTKQSSYSSDFNTYYDSKTPKLSSHLIDIQDLFNHDPATIPQDHTWLKASTLKYESKQEKTAAQAKLRATIEFELLHSNIFRLDDHVAELASSFSILPSDALKIIQTMVNPLYLIHHDTVVQLTYECPETIAWCKKNKLLPITRTLLSTDPEIYCAIFFRITNHQHLADFHRAYLSSTITTANITNLIAPLNNYLTEAAGFLQNIVQQITDSSPCKLENITFLHEETMELYRIYNALAEKLQPLCTMGQEKILYDEFRERLTQFNTITQQIQNLTAAPTITPDLSSPPPSTVGIAPHMS